MDLELFSLKMLLDTFEYFLKMEPQNNIETFEYFLEM